MAQRHMPTLLGLRDLQAYTAAGQTDSTSRAAQKAAERLLQRLFWEASCGNLSLTFICPFGHYRGRCRCPQLGREIGKEWSYFSTIDRTRHWRVDADSILAQTPEQIRRLHPTTAVSVKAFIERLRLASGTN